MAWVLRHGKKRPQRALGVYDKKTGETERLYKWVRIKVIVGDKTFLHQFRAPAQRGYAEKDIEEMLERIIEHLDEKFPVLEFKQVPLFPNAYNFIAVAFRDQAAPGISERDSLDRGLRATPCDGSSAR